MNATRTGASAPGKVILCGEYAILEGHVAVVAAINRRARARLQDSAPEEALFSAAQPYLSDDEWQRMRRIVVDTESFRTGQDKLGIGSSAAAITAAVHLAMANENPPRCLKIAHAAHAAFQEARGARGSGIDVAAAVIGGVCAARLGGVAPVDTTPLSLPKDLELVFVWTGSSASTPELVAKVRQARNESSYRLSIAAIAAASRQFIDACQAKDARGCVAAVHSGGDAIASLGRATQAPLVLETHRQIRAIAASRGGSAKATGAGGGDLAVAAFHHREHAEAFRADLDLAGISAVDLSVDLRGAETDDPRD